MNRLRNSVLTIASLFAGLLAVAPARAASLQKVEQSVWQGGVTLPSYVNMYIYVPDKLATKPPILVGSHHCQGTGKSTFDETKSTLVPLADKNGFIMIFPEATGHNCWDVGSDKSLKHDGGGDTHAVAQMVRYTISKYGANPGRVYAFGGSSGGMMTQGLLGVYPDIFMGGVSVSGVPCGCWSEQYSGDVATNGQWSGPCAGGSVTKTAEQWGDYVRSMFPGYTGHRPRVQLWHGDPDPTINYKNMTEAIKEWTNLLGLGATPTTTENPDSNTTHQIWKNSCGYVVLEAFSIKGAGHGVQWNTNTVAGFLSLDKVADEDPETAACGGGTGGAGGGSGGATGAGGTGGGAGGAGGATDGGVGGTTGAGGTGGARDGGRDVGRDGSAPGTGGGVGSGGTGSGGTLASGGTSASGGIGSGGSGGLRSGGTVGSGGAVGSGGSVASGGSVGSGGSSATGGAASGGSATGGAGGQGGSSIGGDPAAASGCSCAIGNRARPSAAAAAAILAALGLAFRRKRR